MLSVCEPLSRNSDASDFLKIITNFLKFVSYVHNFQHTFPHTIPHTFPHPSGQSWRGSHFFCFLMPVKKAFFTGILTGPRDQLGPNEEK